jgi:tetratricopeptide (TPR) repeat protein
MLLWTGKQQEALESFQKALLLQQKLVDANPTEVNFQLNLAGMYAYLGVTLDRQKRWTEALAALDTSVAMLQKLAKVDATNGDSSRELGVSYSGRGGALSRAGKPAEAAADLRRAVELLSAQHPSSMTDAQFALVRARALLAALGGDARSGVTKEEAKTFAEQSVSDLAALVKTGWAYPSELKEPDFDGLRGRADFQKLVAEVEAKAEKR